MKFRTLNLSSVLIWATLPLLLILARAAEPASGRNFYVSTAGSDTRDGRSPDTAWQSLEKVNAAELRPGDRVLFRRGDTWRGQLVPHSGSAGAAITYTAYGSGAMPLLLGSVSRNRPEDWQDEGHGIWSTPRQSLVEIDSLPGLATMPWSVHSENGAKVKLTKPTGETKDARNWQLDCTASGSQGNHIQFQLGGLAVQQGECYLLTFRVRCTQPFTIHRISLSKAGPPWTAYGSGHGHAIKVGPEWAECSVRFKGLVSASDGRLALYLGGALPAGSSFTFQPLSWTRVEGSDSDALPVDVGNLIFDSGKTVGIKKWKAEDLKQPGDYCYDAANWQLRLRSDGNPAAQHRNIECALTRHVVSQGGKSFVTYQGLGLRYGAAHGFGGGSTRGIVIRDCDIGWIGGGHQFTRPDGKPVRFGNGIEFWSGARDCLVEGCRIWEVYDAALTNQGSHANEEVNITYRDNVIWNSEYSFEYWNGGPESVTRDIRFEHNTCVNAGGGWGHAQRPDRNGRHLMFYWNKAKTSGVSISDNLFCQATESLMRMENDWTSGLAMDRNCWWQREGAPLVMYLRKPVSSAQFAEFRQQTGLDAHALVADPGFVAADRLDFTLRPDSPARRLSADGTPLGARRRTKAEPNG